MSSELLDNVHLGLVAPGESSNPDVTLTRGGYDYYHYGCDGVDDRGWGCGYRTLQTLCSWVRKQQYLNSNDEHQHVPPVPSILEIQQMLTDIKDKPASFVESRQWIGSFEVCLIFDTLYDVPCKIIHITKGVHLPEYLDQLITHFQHFASPIMMGGDSDNSSKGILGVCLHPQALLVLDPHYYGVNPSVSDLQEQRWVKWMLMSDFHDDSFYNLCLPQLQASLGVR